VFLMTTLETERLLFGFGGAHLRANSVGRRVVWCCASCLPLISQISQ
jgi:hypothetical protein